MDALTAAAFEPLGRYRAKQVVFSQGDPADCVFWIEQGRVQLTVLSSDGKQAVVALLGSGDFLGEACLAGHSSRMQTATAITECSLARLDRARVGGLMHQPEFADLFVSHLIRRTVRSEEDLVDQLFNPCEKRLARVLLLLARYREDGPPETEAPKVSQEMLASMIGSTRSRVSFFMTKFRKLGFIEYGDRLQVRSSLRKVILRD